MNTVKTGRIVFKDLDGNSIMDRKSDTRWWSDEFVKITLECDARERGVKVVKINILNSTTIDCTVDYLSRKK